MRKRSLLAIGVSNAAVQIVLGVQEFRGWAVSVDVDYDAAVSCAYMEKAGNSLCVGQCAEIWCENDEIGDCTSEARVVQLVDRCANYQGGDLVISHHTFLQFSGRNTHLVPVRWTCVGCETNASGSVGSDDAACIEEVLHRKAGTWDDTFVVGSMKGETNENGITIGGKISFSAGSVENDTSGSLDTVVEIPSTANSSDPGNCNIKRESNSDVGDNFRSSDFWSGSGSMQTNTNPWNGEAPPIPSTSNRPNTMIPSFLPASSSSSSMSEISLTPIPVPTMSPASSSNGRLWSVSPWIPSNGDSSTPVSPPTSPSLSSGGSSYHVETVTTPVDNSPGSVGARSALPGLSRSTSDTTDKNQSPATTTAAPALPSGGSTDNGNLSATSPVTESPFFYASIVLGIAILGGVIIGYRAKRKRNHRIEMRAFRMTTRQSTRTDTPVSISCSASSPLVPQTHFDNPSIVIL